MAKPKNLYLTLLLTILYSSLTPPPSTAVPLPTGATTFITNSCKNTTYPALCVKSLSAYASNIKQSPHQLAQTALNVSMTQAQSAKSFIAKMGRFKGLEKMQYQAIRDCVEVMEDCVDRLRKSIEELKQVNHDDTKSQSFLFRMRNVQTWVSAALTDETTCSDGFDGRAMDGKVKSSVQRSVFKVGQFISNALGLVNRYASKQ